jgi:hypothetical protein
MEMLAPDTPLCPAGHLSLKGGDWLTRQSALIPQRLRLVPNVNESVISPLEGEMSGRTEGGEKLGESIQTGATQ